MKMNAVIFGAGTAGRRTFQYYRNRYQVIAFADNDPAKAGQSLFGRPIIPAAEISSIHYEHILIGSTYASEITRQLLDMGIPAEKIGWIDGDILEGAYAHIHFFRCGIKLFLGIIGIGIAGATTYIVTGWKPW